MECQEWDSFLHDFGRTETADGGVGANVLEHIAHCSRCGERFSNVRLLEQALRRVAEGMDPEQSAARMEPVLRTVFRQQQRTKRRPESILSWVAFGTAASLLLAIGVGSWQKIVFPLPMPPRLAMPRPAQAASAHTSEPILKPAAKTRIGAGWKAQPRSQGAEHQEMVTEFYALPYAQSSGRAFSGEIVRVKLAASALPAIGFPVALNGDRGAEPITADLWVGENGLPLAIRFVR